MIEQEGHAGAHGKKGKGSNLGGYNWLKYLLIHPRPDPLPSREREFWTFYQAINPYNSINSKNPINPINSIK